MDNPGTTTGERRPGVSYGMGMLHRLVAAVVAGGALALAGCAAGGDPSPDAASRSESPSPSDLSADDTEGDATPDTSSQGEHSSSSGLPAAADGTDLAACADGRCEVRVSAGSNLSVPRRLGVASVRVQSVEFDTVTVVGRYLGYSQRGFCTGTSCNSSSSGNRFKVVLGTDSKATENGLSITAVAANGESAVLQLAPE
ncbi:hypothetical protein [Nonomuraea sp. CA-141351]|uniref:hypothetical protein n=1 Tax=Nonomuraea sp. CA-141351 TaxID=3239996 RepID=UPI003D917B92